MNEATRNRSEQRDEASSLPNIADLVMGREEIWQDYTEVEIHGLKNAVALNGCRGYVKGFIRKSSRYSVILDWNADEEKMKLVKPQNLKKIADKQNLLHLQFGEGRVCWKEESLIDTSLDDI